MGGGRVEFWGVDVGEASIWDDDMGVVGILK